MHKQSWSLLTLLFIILGIVGCRSHVRLHSGPAGSKTLSPAERQYLEKYCVIRNRVMRHFKLSLNASAEEARPHLATFLKMHRGATWEEMLAHPLVQKLCTERHREKFLQIFELPKEASWLALKDRLEELRLQFLQ